jgi:aerobic-type carbon monoxide dehydrogenase small subunit (CoxS/CutS family)
MNHEQIRIAEMAVALVDTRIKERLDQCGYCESGHNAYAQASLAISAAFKDVRGVFHKMRHEISDEGEGS